MKIKSIIISIVAIIAFSSIAFAQEVKPTDNQDSTKQEKGLRKHRGHKKSKMHGFKGLNLSDAQKEQMKALKERNKAAFKPQREELKTLAAKKREGIITADEENRLKEIRETMKANGQKMHEEMMGILTPEQKTQIDQMKSERRGKMKGFKKNRGESTEKPKDN